MTSKILHGGRELTSQPSSDSSQIKKLHQRAQQLVNSKRYSEASDLCLKILNLDSEHADAHFLLGIILFDKGQVLKSVELIRKSIELDGTCAEYYIYLAKCLVLMKEDGEASRLCDQAVELGLKEASMYDTLGNIYSRLGDHKKAASAFERAVQLNPRSAEYHYNLASSLRFIGDFNAAEQSYEDAIAIVPDHYKAHSSLATIKKQSLDSNHVERLESLLTKKKSLDVRHEMHLRYALSKEYEDIEQFDHAFEHLKKANDIHKQCINYAGSDDMALFEKIKEVCSKEFLNVIRSGYSTQEPIFVVGMPRTGTTLVERILSSHSQVKSAGELQNFGVALKQLTGDQSNLILDSQTVEKASNLDFAELGRNYIKSTRQLTGTTPYFVDKLPMNFLYVGFIAMALPGAKIICLKRNPMDTCFSNYKQLFSIGHSYYNYSYDLEDVGRYYLHFNRLMAYWKSVLPERLLEVEYESIVEQQTQESRRIIDWCGLPWEDQCLSFYENQSPVSTASSVQVRQPIYKSSINRWRYFEKHLGVLHEILRDGGINLK